VEGGNIYFQECYRYLCAYSDYRESEFVIFGVPYDGTATYKPGARFGPDEVRRASWVLETYSPNLRRDLTEVKIADLDNIIIEGDQREILDRIYRAALGIMRDGKKVVVIGGDHSITYPLVKAAKEVYGDLVLVHFDAHCDLREEYLGNRYSHASVIRRCYQVTGDIYQFGIRSGDREEWEFAWSNTHIFNRLPGEEEIQEIGSLDKPVYITIDIDVLDPAYAPGTGTPEPCGYSTKELIDALYLFRNLRDKIVGFDIVEVSPPCDVNSITSITAAKIIRELILTLGR